MFYLACIGISNDAYISWSRLILFTLFFLFEAKTVIEYANL